MTSLRLCGYGCFVFKLWIFNNSQEFNDQPVIEWILCLFVWKPYLINTMADRHPAQTASGFFKHLKKVFRPGSQSTPPSRPTTPPADLAPTITTNLEEAAKLRAKYTHLRILVIGRANAGKTTLLKRVCNAKDDPVYSTVGYQLRFIPNSYCPFTDRLTRPPTYYLCPFP